MAEPPKKRWLLPPATTDDVDGLHALSCQPLVYRYLFDAEPNAGYFAVMRRLGMQVHKDVEYPLGAGAAVVMPDQYHGPNCCRSPSGAQCPGLAPPLRRQQCLIPQRLTSNR